MRLSNYYLPTLKEAPAEAEIISHQLMLRAGLIKQVSSGIYTWLPLGLTVYKKIEAIVREEMNNIGALEIDMPSAQPAELWQDSGRWQDYGPELLRFKDRHQRDFCIGPTHEEIVTDLLKGEVQSYKQLPITVYQIQKKFRDEIRPRFGVMRGREFLMKDAYSFHADSASLETTYQAMYQAYQQIFTRMGLDFCAVEADSGSIGGSRSHEFHVLADSGEDVIMFSDGSDFASNIESTQSLPVTTLTEPTEAMRLVDTPDTKTIAALVEKYQLPIEKTIKTLVVKAATDCDSDLIALLVRGDHELNAIKAEKHPWVASPLQMASEDDIRQAIGAGPGSLGPVNLPIPFIADETVAAMSDFGAGANIEAKHYFGINWGRDVALGEVMDIRNAKVGDPSPDGSGHLRMARGIEVGHIFQLGKKYSEAMQMTVLDEHGKAVTPYMGCYGVGVTRLVAAAIEQHHDDKGIIWPPAIAPFSLVIAPINYGKSAAVTQFADDLYQTLRDKGIPVVLDDRGKRPGVMFSELELIGIPHRVVIGDKTLADNEVEYQGRTDESSQRIATDTVLEFLLTTLNKTA